MSDIATPVCPHVPSRGYSTEPEGLSDKTRVAISMSVSPVFSHGKMSSIKGFLGLTWKMQEVSYVGQANS